MAISPTIQREIKRQITQIHKPPAAPWGPARAAEYIRAHGLKIEALADDDAPPSALRARLAAAYAAYAPTTPGDVALVEQVVASSLDAERCRRLQARLRTEKRRTAELRWEQEQEDYVHNYLYMLDTNPYEALPRLKRTAAGCRYLAQEWRRLAAVLAAEGTWYQHDCVKSINLQGYSAVVEHLYFSEEAYLTLLHCVGAQRDPKPFDIELVLDPQVMPKPIADRGVVVWPPDPAESRAYLEALVARELPAIEALEAKLRVEYEEPARAAARELDQIENSWHEARLLRDLRSHERSVQLAHQALMKRKPQRTGC
jgi:hypothetical protein